MPFVPKRDSGDTCPIIEREAGGTHSYRCPVKDYESTLPLLQRRQQNTSLITEAEIIHTVEESVRPQVSPYI